MKEGEEKKEKEKEKKLHPPRHAHVAALQDILLHLPIVATKLQKSQRGRVCLLPVPGCRMLAGARHGH